MENFGEEMVRIDFRPLLGEFQKKRADEEQCQNLNKNE